MKKLRIISLTLAVLLLTLSVPDLAVVQSETENVGFLLKSTVQYSNPSQNQVWDFTGRENDRTIGLFMNNNWQTVTLLNSTYPVEAIRNDEDGNPTAVLQFQESMLKPGENVSFTVWYQIISKPRAIPSISENESLHLADIPPALVLEYTRQEGPWQTTHQALRELAFSLKGNETRVLTIIKNFIVWTKDHISYPQGRHENPYYPNETYTHGEGDCDDQAMLLITLSRIVGIPSYLQVGGIYLKNYFDNASYWDGQVTNVERQIGWHGWAVAYIPPWGWLPVDLTYVPEGFADPLNAIKHGAVTSQDTVQYMNVTHTDYVASSLEARTFLSENGFHVFMEDEMILDPPDQKPSTVTVDPWVPLVFLALMVFLVATSFLFLRRSTRENIKNAQTSRSEHFVKTVR